MLMRASPFMVAGWGYGVSPLIGYFVSPLAHKNSSMSLAK